MAALIGCVGLFGHEIGTSRVTVVFEPQAYTVEVVTDAISLMDKLEATAGSSTPADASVQLVRSLLPGFDESFRRRVKVMFDSSDVRPQIEYSVKPGTGTGASAVATIRLTGPIPPGARDFRWNYGWTFASYALTLRNGSDHPTTVWLEGGQSSKPFPLAAPAPAVNHWTTVLQYLALGFTHILPNGFDHMLFVLGLYLLSHRPRSVLTQVSAFTVAHSITLGLSMYGVVSVPSRIVEPLIAISIAYVAIENIFISKLKPWRIGLVFGFGLLHGMGFAGALKEVGLPRSEFLTALLTFNVGVEAGQLAVIGAAFLLLGWHYSQKAWYHARLVVPISMMIACTAVYWTIQRVAV
jgi:hypothetical protein